MTDKLYVFANMGHLDQLPKSGGQTSARRVMKGLESSGFDIIPIRRHRNEWEGRVLHKLEALLFAVVDPVKIIFRMLFGKRKNSAFLHLTYAGPLVPYELFLTILVRMMGYKSLIYLKGGQVLDCYRDGSRMHRWMFKKTMDMQRKVFFEGMESLRLVEGISKTPLVYFPNYVFDEKILKVLPHKPKDNIKILYFGRVAPNKNVHVGIEAFNILCEKYDNVHYTIIGGLGQSKAYGDEIDRMILASPYSDKITRIGNSTQEFLAETMSTHHFFLFPSKEKAEGHSNSLNEAMSQGLIPIVSDYHFNRTVVGDDRLVVDGFEANAYAEKILWIIENCDLEVLATQMRDRVREKFAFSVVNQRIADEMRSA